MEPGAATRRAAEKLIELRFSDVAEGEPGGARLAQDGD